MLDVERLRGMIRKCKLPGDGGNETNDVQPIYPLPHPWVVGVAFSVIVGLHYCCTFNVISV
jgi:hypothetical protein